MTTTTIGVLWEGLGLEDEGSGNVVVANTRRFEGRPVDYSGEVNNYLSSTCTCQTNAPLPGIGGDYTNRMI